PPDGRRANAPVVARRAAHRRAGRRAAVRRTAAGALRRHRRRGRVRAAGPSARGDGAGRVPAGAARRPRRRGRLPGHLPRAGPQGPLSPSRRQLPVRRRRPRHRERAAQGGATGVARAPGGGRRDGRPGRRRRRPAGRAILVGAAAPEVVTLAEGAMRSMIVSKLTITAAVVLAVGLVGTGAGWVAWPAAGPGPAFAEAAPLPAKAGDAKAAARHDDD